MTTAYIVCTLGITLLSGVCRDDAEYGGTVEVKGVFLDDMLAAQAFCDKFNLARESGAPAAEIVSGGVLNDIRVLKGKNPRDLYKEAKS